MFLSGNKNNAGPGRHYKIVEGVGCSIVTLVALKGQIILKANYGVLIPILQAKLYYIPSHFWELTNSIQFPIAEAILYDA